MRFSTQSVLVAALLANEAVAANIHRHHHHRRAAPVKYVEEEVTVTDWTTVTVYEDFPKSKSIYRPGPHKHTTLTTASLSISASANSTNTTASSTVSTSSTSSSFSTSLYTTPTTLATSTIAPAPSPAAPTTETPTPTPTPTTTSTSTPAPAPTTSSTAAAIVIAAPAADTPTTVEATAAAPETVDPTTPVAATTTQSAAKTTTAAAAAATTTAASSSSSSSSSSASGTKRGLAYNSGSLLEPFLGSGAKCSWSYNWGQVADSSAPDSVEFVPMLWGPNTASEWDSNAETAISNGATNFLSFNECDNSGQCNLDAASAATQHIKLMNPYSGRVRIGTPAITNSNLAGEGVDWLTSFLSACGGECAYDFCAAHWYNTPDADDFFNHLVQVHDVCGKPVWITEFAPLGSDDEINAFLETVLDKLDNDSTYSFVERYSYFMAATGSLLSSETELSTYGQTYAYSG